MYNVLSSLCAVKILLCWCKFFLIFLEKNTGKKTSNLVALSLALFMSLKQDHTDSHTHSIPVWNSVMREILKGRELVKVDMPKIDK